MTENRPAWRREGRAFVELFALSGLAMAQPLLDIFGRAPHQFVFRGATGTDVLLFGLAAVFAVPVALSVGEAVVGLVSQRLRRAVHLVLLGALVATLAVQALRPLVSQAPLFALAALVGLLAVYAYHRFEAAKVWLAFVAIAPVVFLVLFLVASPTARLLTGGVDVARGAGVAEPAPVVLLVFDELPLVSIMDSEGAVDAELFPTFAAFADESHWFRNTTSPSTFTWHAMPSLLTGVLPTDGTAPFAQDHPNNLVTLLADSYRLNVVESVSRLCPTTLCEPTGGRGLLVDDAREVVRERLSWSGPQGDPVAGFAEQAALPREEALPDEEVRWAHTERVARLIDGIVDDSLTLHLLHLLLPHQPLRYLPSGVAYDGPDPDIGRVGDRFDDRTWPPVLSRHRHLLQVKFVDDLLGQILDRLREVGVYDDALIVVTSDHGIAFQPGKPTRLLDGDRLDDEVAPEMLWVPLFVKLPGQTEPVVDDANVIITDLLPTIADVLGMELPHDVDGRSAFGPPRADGAKPFRHSEVHAFGIGVTDEVTVDGDGLLARLRELGVDRFLPHRGSPERLWQVGPSAELVGQPADGLPLLDADVHGAPFDVEAGASVVPAIIRADLADIGVGDPVAIALNGVVAATAEVYDEGGRPAVAAMVSDERFRPGRNEVTLHRIP
jgi:hypothetical protein